MYGVNRSCCLICSLSCMIVGGSLLWRANDALLYPHRLHTFDCGVNRHRWLVRSCGSSHGNYTQDTHGGRYKHSFSCQDERGNRLNKAYPYRNQAQVQYINLAWINEKGKRMWHKVYKVKENTTLGSYRRPPFWSNNENELCPNYIFPI